jgi:subtilisin family serine protease
MYNRRDYTNGLLVLLVITLLISPLASCVNGPPTVLATETEETVTEAEETITEAEEPVVETVVAPPPVGVPCTPLPAQPPGGFDPRQYKLPEVGQGFYLDGVVIVTGQDSDKIDLVMTQVLTTTPVQPPVPVDEIRLGDLIIRIYEYSADDYPTVWDIVLTIYGISMQLGVNVYGDPDYVFGDPWDIQGSPWDIQGSPWPSAPETANLDAQEAFWDQWALANASYGIGTTGDGGAGIEVAIFDTSPFEAPGPYTFTLMYSDLPLCVSHPVPVMAPEGSVDYRDHGLAVAGLAHAAAPESSMHLVRVLNERAEGDLFSLLYAISLYLHSTLDDRGLTGMDPGDTLANVVINLSLGLRPEQTNPPTALRHLFDPALDPPDYLKDYGYQFEQVPGWRDFETDIWESEAQESEDWKHPIQKLRDELNLPEAEIPVLAFRLLLRFATDHGAVVVAAAGNDSAPLPPQVPARWPEVIGVGASNLPSSEELPASACYSNQGDVYAPGGDGDGHCTPQLQQCVAQPGPDCPYGLITLVTDPNSGPPAVGSTTQPAYAYWVGTSFSTPLVTGLVALYLQNGNPHAMAASLQDACQAGVKPGMVSIQ